jgi:hypothetical protein
MGVALNDVASWIEPFSKAGTFDVRNGCIERLKSIAEALSFDFDYWCFTRTQVEKFVDAHLDCMPFTFGSFTFPLKTSAILRGNQFEYEQLYFRGYSEKHFVEHGGLYYDFEEINYVSPSIIRHLQAEFEGKVLTDFDWSESERKHLTQHAGTPAFFQSFRALEQKRELSEKILGKSGRDARSRLM